MKLERENKNGGWWYMELLICIWSIIMAPNENRNCHKPSYLEANAKKEFGCKMFTRNQHLQMEQGRKLNCDAHPETPCSQEPWNQMLRQPLG